MNKIVAAEELQRLATLFGSLTEVAAELRHAGSMEQAFEEAKKLREAEMAELDKVKAAVKKAKEDLKKAELAVQDQASAFIAARDDMDKQLLAERNEHEKRMSELRAEAQVKLSALDAKVAAKVAAEESVISEKVKAASAKLDFVLSETDAKHAELTVLNEKLEKAKKALAKLGMTFSEE